MACAATSTTNLTRDQDNLVDQISNQYNSLSIQDEDARLNGFGGGLFEEPTHYETRPMSASGTLRPSLPWQDEVVRSHSAAPGLMGSIGPVPPGIGKRSESEGSSSNPHVRRPASTGAFDGNDAFRPSAKTFMDLIEEDYPEDNRRHRNTGPIGDVYSNAGYGRATSKDRVLSYGGTGYGSAPGDLSHQQPTHYDASSRQQPLYMNENPQTHMYTSTSAGVPGYGYNQSLYLSTGREPSQQFVQVVPVQSPGSTPGAPYWQAEPGIVAQSVRQDGYDRKARGGRGHRKNNRDPKQPSSSPLLDEFRTSKNRSWSIFQIENHVVEFCQDQNGSRFIQQRLEMSDPREQDAVMREVLPAIRRLRNDVFGNYVVQKLLDFGTESIRMQIRDTMAGEMLQMSLQMYGCRVVQKALETLKDVDLASLLDEFQHNVLSLIHDQNGNHVIQKCIEVVKTRSMKAQAAGDQQRIAYLENLVEFIISDVLVNTASLSCHPYGCRVLQRILEHSSSTRKTNVLERIKACHRRLLDDQYGNYVIQHVLQYGRSEDRDSILAIVVESGLLGLSRQKFASNVVEKLLKHGNDSHRKGLVREMLKVSPCGTSACFD